MATTERDLLEYDELLESLTGRLESLSIVHGGLTEAVASLVHALRKLDEINRSVEALASSNQATLDEIKRLQPAELGAAIDGGIESLELHAVALRQELSGELGRTQAALVQRSDAIAAHVAAFDAATDTRLAALDGALGVLHREASSWHGASTAQVAAVETQIERALADAQTAIKSALTSSTRSLRDLVAKIDDRQEKVDKVTAETAVAVREVQSQETALSQQLAALSLTMAELRGNVDATRATAESLQRVTGELGPLIVSSVESARAELRRELTQTKLVCLLGFTAVLAIVLLI